MRLTLRQLQIFQAVAKAGGTAAAANLLPLSQSATSAALSELEQTLGAPLFDRIGKRLVINDFGRTVLPMALAMLDSARTIELALPAKDQGLSHVRLFASTTIGNHILPALLARYREVAPVRQLDVRIGNTSEAVQAVTDFSADFGLIEGPCHASDLTVSPWLQEELLIVASPLHPLARLSGRRLTIEQLRQAPWLLREPGSGTRESVELALRPHLLHVEPVMTLGSSESIKNAAVEGLGISCLSAAVVHDFVSARRLTVLKSELPPLVRQFALISHRRKVLSDSLQRFVEFCQRHSRWPDERASAYKSASRAGRQARYESSRRTRK
ncbi:MAG TPA: LysR family transcriptional regulator [Steroidobacteraceae bacterium]|jgi:DNA-binding transcriptional LysR family regulator